MRPIDIGCYPESEIFFYTPGNQARQTFFYPLCAGHFYCNPRYRVQRNRYDSFLLIYVKRGRGFLTLSPAALNRPGEDDSGKTYEFSSGDLISIDCYQPHAYGTTTDNEILWLHFDGSTSRQYMQMLLHANGPVCQLKNALAVENSMKKIITLISSQQNINDALCSCCIVQLLTDALTNQNIQKESASSSNIIEDTLSYISNHIKEELSLTLLADRAGLSPFYFTRLFKKETGYTPHNYIIQSRVNIAKFYLKSSSYSIKEICFNSGFPSESSFCATFKKVCGMRPSEYKAGEVVEH